MHHELHLGVNVTANLEGSRRRKGFGNILARISLVAIKSESWRLDIDLMDELVIIGESQAFAAVDADLGGAEGAAFLDDGMSLIGGEAGCWNEQEKREQFFHRVTT
ncbi:MAG TPA: hypothetical protein VFA87_10315 [Rhizomicrobium sp.]|nr:hypothetical protein [Rhizomicrobium sp.]